MTTETTPDTQTPVDPPVVETPGVTLLTEAPASEAQPPADPPADPPVEETVPEVYEDFAVPEGVSLDAELTTELKTLAKELGLTQTKAQQIADLGPKLMQKWEAKQAETLSATVTQWAETTRADKELGGEALDANLGVAKQALTEFGSPELKALLYQSGLGNHPEVIRLLYRAGKAISNDTTFRGGPPPGERKAADLYPNSAMNP